MLARMNDAITVVGSLAADPTLKSVNGDQVAEFRLGCTARRKEGETWVDAHTNWYGVEAWGGFADHVRASLRKGDLVIVSGKLRIDQWESGDKRGTSVRIRAEHVGHSLRVGPTTRARRGGPVEASGDAQRPPEQAEPESAAAGPAPDAWADPAAAMAFGT